MTATADLLTTLRTRLAPLAVETAKAKDNQWVGKVTHPEGATVYVSTIHDGKVSAHDADELAAVARAGIAKVRKETRPATLEDVYLGQLAGGREVTAIRRDKRSITVGRDGKTYPLSRIRFVDGELQLSVV